MTETDTLQPPSLTPHQERRELLTQCASFCMLNNTFADVQRMYAAFSDLLVDACTMEHTRITLEEIGEAAHVETERLRMWSIRKNLPMPREQCDVINTIMTLVLQKACKGAT